MNSPGRTLLGPMPNRTAFAWEVYAHSIKYPKTYVLLPNEEWVDSVYEDIKSWDPQRNVFCFKGHETDLVRNRSASAPGRKDRLEFLTQHYLSSQNKKENLPSSSPVFLCSADAFAQNCPSSEFFHSHSKFLSIGDLTSPSELQEFLVEAGYAPSELVEIPGQFASRGAILDVFPPTENKPLRIELWDDEISMIRSFHPESQRKVAEMKQVLIGPAREFSLAHNNESRNRQLKNVKAEIRNLKKNLSERNALLRLFEQGSLFPEIDYWAGLLRDNGSEQNPLLNSIDSFDIVVDGSNVLTQFNAKCSADKRNFELASEDRWLPNPQYFFCDFTSVAESIQSRLSRAPLWLEKTERSASSQAPKDHRQPQSETMERLQHELADKRGDITASIDTLLSFAKEEIQHNSVYFVSTSNTHLDRMRFLLEHRGVEATSCRSFHDLPSEDPNSHQFLLLNSTQEFGLKVPGKACFIPSSWIFGHAGFKTKPQNKKRRRNNNWENDLAFKHLSPGDVVVHEEHGLGIYRGMKSMDFNGIPTDLIELEYKDGNKLFVPVTRLSQVQKYSIGNESPPLDRLGGQSWEKKKASAKKDLRSIAGDLLQLYSVRELTQGPKINCSEEKIAAFASEFPYDETEDQAKAIQACLEDIKGPRPMDRLLCGDVGYGKTEVALRAAHAAASEGYQVAVIAPTTLLAEQHESNFRKRLKPFGIHVDGLSRFKSAGEKSKILDRLNAGDTGVIVGTHALLGNRVNFSNLGLLIVDEEQKFGVTHKEKIKQLRNDIHVLSMSATPIPRTLNMALSGVKELSIISTPPAERLSVKTFIAKKSMPLIQDAVQKELKRGGQVFYVHNRVQSIREEFEELQAALPNVQMDYAHGQMHERELEEKVHRFYNGETSLLVATSIIESGLDIPNANTLIVDRADNFGLSQLYQLRGRVGRASDRAYAYLLTPSRGKITPIAEERLDILNNYQELGSGFHIASHDLDIRGSGDLLGRKQSGQMTKLGFETYSQLLQECIAELKGEDLEARIDPDIQIPLDTSIPDSYLPDIGLRLMIYRRLSAAASEHEIDETAEELRDRFGPEPQSVEQLFVLMRIKCQLRRLGVRAAVASKSGVSLTFANCTPIDVNKVLKSVEKYPTHYKLVPDGKLLIKRPANAEESDSSDIDIVRRVESALAQLEAWCADSSN